MNQLLPFALLVTLVSCSGGSTTGNPISVNVRLQDAQPFAWWKPIRNSVLIPEAMAAVSNVFLCFKRIRFKYDDASEVGGSDNIDIELGRVSLDPTGTSIGSYTIPEGSYERIEIDLEKECDGVASRPSVEFTNGNSPFSYSSQDRITIKFDGQFVAAGGQTIDLDVDGILDVMDAITPADDIKDLLEDVTGDFD